MLGVHLPRLWLFPQLVLSVSFNWIFGSHCDSLKRLCILMLGCPLRVLSSAQWEATPYRRPSSCPYSQGSFNPYYSSDVIIHLELCTPVSIYDNAECLSIYVGGLTQTASSQPPLHESKSPGELALTTLPRVCTALPLVCRDNCLKP